MRLLVVARHPGCLARRAAASAPVRSRAAAFPHDYRAVVASSRSGVSTGAPVGIASTGQTPACKQALRDAAEQRVCEPAVAMRADHDQVCLDLLGDLRDRARGVATGGGADDERCVDAPVAQILDLLGDLLAQLRLVRENGVSAAAADEDLAHVDDDQLGLVGLRQVERVRKRQCGSLGTIRCPENCLEHEMLLSVDPTLRPQGGWGIRARPDPHGGLSAGFDIGFSPWMPSRRARAASARCSTRQWRSDRSCPSSRSSSVS